MASVLHRCPNCGYETEAANTLPMLAENPHCRQCGLSASESEGKLTNDLASLFARQMNMEGVQQAGIPHTDTPMTPDVISPTSPSEHPIVYSITQHYHHSSHQAFPPSASSHPPGMPSVPEPSDVPPEEMLRAQAIDPGSLFPSQVALFKEATMEQRNRLMELWRISPRGPSGQSGHMQSTSNEMGGTHMATPGTQDDEMMDAETHEYTNAEPYVVSGYEQTALNTPYIHSTDPVYKGRDLWQQQQQPPHEEQQRMEMEDQYGAFESQRMFFGCGIRRAHWLGENESLV